MTFIEAALEILRREGTPLHARVIADKAVDAELLSHVGKTPVQTMSKRVSASVAKGKGPFVRVKPGVFALEVWKNESGKLVPPGKPKQSMSPPPKAELQGDPIEKADANKSNAIDVSVDTLPTAQSNGRSDKGVADSVVAVEESKRESREPARKDGEAPKNAKGRNRRSKGRGNRDPRQKERRDVEGANRPHGDLERNGTEQFAKSDVREEPRKDQRAKSVSREEPRKEQRRGGNDARQSQRNDGGRGKKNREESRNAPPHERSAALGFAGQVEALLSQQKHPLSSAVIADKLRFSPANADLIVDALLDADNLEREHNGRRIRFVRHKSGWALSAREIPADVVHLEDNVFDSAARLSQIAERQVYRRMKSLPMGRLAQLVILVLKQMGYGAIEPVPRGKDGEVHLRISDRRQGGGFYTAVVIRKETSGRPVGDVEVSSLRGTLHHYKASRGLIVTTGEISNHAQREADAPNLAPVGFLDGKALAMEMVRSSIGVEKRNVQLAFFDESWF